MEYLTPSTPDIPTDDPLNPLAPIFAIRREEAQLAARIKVVPGPPIGQIVRYHGSITLAQGLYVAVGVWRGRYDLKGQCDSRSGVCCRHEDGICRVNDVRASSFTVLSDEGIRAEVEQRRLYCYICDGTGHSPTIECLGANQ